MLGFIKDFGSIFLWFVKREIYVIFGENFYGFFVVIGYICVLLFIRN